jgi:hypothetical protein
MIFPNSCHAHCAGVEPVECKETHGPFKGPMLYFVPDCCVPERKVTDDESLELERDAPCMDEASLGRGVPWTRLPWMNRPFDKLSIERGFLGLCVHYTMCP